MPTDLDDIFASVARQADAIPLGTAGQARKRGRQRTRNGLIGAAAAVCLVLAGAGVAAGSRLSNEKPAAPTPAPSVAVGPLPLVGEPIPFGTTYQSSNLMVAAGRVFSTWRAPDNTTSVIAADLRTGKLDWKLTGIKSLGEQAVNYGVRAVDQGVMVAVDSQIYVYDPAQQNPNDWVLTVSDLDEVVPFDKALVRRWSINGQVDAHDWRTGRKLWSIDPGADGGPDRIVRVIGVRPAGSPEDTSGFRDNRLLAVTRTGKVQVRDVRTGDLLRTITPASSAVEGNQLTAYGEMVYEIGPGCCDTEAYRVVATNLESGASSVILKEGVGHAPGGLDVCGPGLVCVLDQGDNALSTVSAVEVATKKKLWSVPGPSGAGSISARGDTMLIGGGQTTVLLSNKGEQLWKGPSTHVDWLDDKRLLVLPTTGAGDVVTVGIADQKVTRLGTVPQRVDMCVHLGDRLACPTEKDLRIYDISG